MCSIWIQGAGRWVWDKATAKRFDFIGLREDREIKETLEALGGVGPELGIRRNDMHAFTNRMQACIGRPAAVDFNKT
jgi:hypothetical protein